MSNILLWEAKLAGRKNAVEFNLANYRKRWWVANNMREDLLKGTDSYVYFSERMVDMESRIADMLDELEFINGLFNCGPVKGGEIALVVRRSVTGQKLDVPKTRSLLNIIHDRAEDYREGILSGVDGEQLSKEESLLIAQGLDEAYAIIVNPYEYLTEDEKVQYDKVEPAATAPIPQSAASPSAVQIARDMVDHEMVSRPRGHDQQSSETRRGPTPTVEELEAQVDDEDVVVRRQ